MSYDLEQLKKDLQKKKEQRLIMVNTNWGKDGWNFLYNIALSGNGTTENIHNLLQNIGPVLPCNECIKHYDTYLQANNLPDNHAEMFSWLQKLENTIARNKYGKNYKYINRYRQIQKISLIKYTKKNTEIITKSECKSCYSNKRKKNYRTKVIKFN